MSNPKRLKLQLRHVEDLISDQNRMLITDIEPSESERNDVLSLMTSIKDALSKAPPPTKSKYLDQYNRILSNLKEINYDIESFEIKEYTDEPDKPAKHVRFEASAGPLESTPTAEEPETLESSTSFTSTSNTFTPYRDSPTDDGSLTNSELFQQNQYIYEDQDRRLEQISTSVNRQRQIGEGINSELDIHNEILTDLEAQTDRSQTRLDGLTRGVQTFNRKSRECGVCSIIMTLLLVLFILLLI